MQLSFSLSSLPPFVTVLSRKLKELYTFIEASSTVMCASSYVALDVGWYNTLILSMLAFEMSPTVSKNGTVISKEWILNPYVGCFCTRSGSRQVEQGAISPESD